MHKLQYIIYSLIHHLDVKWDRREIHEKLFKVCWYICSIEKIDCSLRLLVSKWYVNKEIQKCRNRNMNIYTKGKSICFL
jgi:hypothetical protein